jgi:heterodisulfide reductase subunit A
MDVACTALRVGTMQADQAGTSPPDVKVAYRRTEAEMPAQELEYRQAVEDGVAFEWLIAPVSADKDSGGLTCCRMELGEPDESGRRRPVPVEGSELLLEADVVIAAIGARPNLSCVPRSVKRTANGRQIAVDEAMMTSVEGVFAGGDAVTGMSFVVDAIGAGHRAAQAMDAYLRGEPLPGPAPELPVAELGEGEIAARIAAGKAAEGGRECTLAEVAAEERVRSFCEVCGPMSESEAIAEAERCLQCGVCSECNQCVHVCGPEAIDHEMVEEVVGLEVGAIVMATGFATWDPAQLPQFGYGISPNVITSLQFERLTSAGGPTQGEILTAEGKKPERVAIVHCVGSRDERAHAYCSRFCCMYSLKQAHQVKDKTGAEVYSIYMDMRAFGKDYEEFYRRIRGEGIQFIQGRPSQVTVDPDDGKLYVEVEDILLGKVVELDVDMVVLATAVEPPPEAGRLAAIFGLGRTPDGWFAEAHPKLRPVETATAGVFLAGCAQGPRDVPDTVAHAGAAALEAVRLFNRGEVTISPTVAEVDATACVGCGECILTCPYTAITRDGQEKAQVNPALCHGCGTCAATCPAGAITALHFTDQEIVAMIDGLLVEA